MATHFKAEPLDIEKLVKVNDLQEITNPVFFVRPGVPTSDGLLSNEIFGITKDTRATTYAYIDLVEYFMHPMFYKIWSRMDAKIKSCIHGIGTYSLDSKGYIIEDPNGSNGINFIRKNIDKIKIRPTDSNKRDVNIKFLMKFKDKMFIKKMLVIPAYFRDVNSSSGKVGVGEINKLYSSLLISVRGLKEAVDYGIQISDPTRGRIQETLLEIYSWFIAEPNVYGKNGILKRSVLSKSVDYGSRLVISAPNLKVESVDEMEVDLDHSAVPLSSLCSNFYPQILFQMRRFFENEFSAGYMDIHTKDGKSERVEIDDPLVQFSDERLKKEIERFMFGYSNRFSPIELKLKNGKTVYLKFKGRSVQQADKSGLESAEGIINRRLTWCDIIYISAVEATRDKIMLITRYPMDNNLGQFPSKIVVSSTKETEQVILNNTLYKSYPKIRESDIGTNTSDKFKDTLNICNLHLAIINGDYDGDQTTNKGLYSDEAIKEQEEFMNSKAFYINLGGSNVRTSSKEANQAIYNMTKALDGTKLDEVKF